MGMSGHFTPQLKWPDTCTSSLGVFGHFVTPDDVPCRSPTISSRFCMKVVKRYATWVGWDPRRGVEDPSDTAVRPSSGTPSFTCDWNKLTRRAMQNEASVTPSQPTPLSRVSPPPFIKTGSAGGETQTAGTWGTHAHRHVACSLDTTCIESDRPMTQRSRTCVVTLLPHTVGYFCVTSQLHQ